MVNFQKLPANTPTPNSATSVVHVPPYMRRARRGGPRHTLEENPGIIDEIVQYIRDGMFFREAVSMVGVHRANAYTWLAKGRKDHDAELDTVQADFWFRVQQALAEAKYDSVTAVRRAGQNPAFWMAAAWYLERRYPQEFGKQDRLQLQHSGGITSATVGIQAILKDDESRKALADVAGILARNGLGTNESNGAGDSDDEWQDGESTTLGFTEPEFA